MAKQTDSFDPAKIFGELLQHAQDAVGEVAQIYIRGDDDSPKWQKKIKAAKKKGVQDIEGWLADELYSDAETIEGLIGDRMYELCGSDPEKIAKVCDHIMEPNKEKKGAWYRACAKIKAGL